MVAMVTKCIFLAFLVLFKLAIGQESTRRPSGSTNTGTRRPSESTNTGTRRPSESTSTRRPWEPTRNVTSITETPPTENSTELKAGSEPYVTMDPNETDLPETTAETTTKSSGSWPLNAWSWLLLLVFNFASKLSTSIV